MQTSVAELRVSGSYMLLSFSCHVLTIKCYRVEVDTREEVIEYTQGKDTPLSSDHGFPELPSASAAFQDQEGD